jgi:hypothetical protein
VGAVVSIEVIESGERVEALVECLKARFPGQAGLRDANMIEVHDLGATTYEQLYGDVETALGECDRNWSQVVRLLKSSQT